MLDYGSILQAGQRLIPDLRAQLLQNEQMQMQRDAIDQRKQVFEAQQAQAGAAAQRQAAFERDRDNALSRNDPNAIRDLMVRYPEFADAIKPAWDAMDESQRRSEYTRWGSVYMRGINGDFDGAATNMRRWLDAEREAGRDDPQAAAILQALESGSDVEKRAAIGQVGVLLAARDDEKFVNVFGKLQPDPEQKDPTQREYDWRVAQFGQEAADRWLKTQDISLVTVEPGGSIYSKEDFVEPESGPSAVTPQPKGGDPASSGGGYALPFENPSFGQPAQQYGASRGGRAHNGLDMSGPLGSPVKPARAGVVVAVGSDGRSGNFVRVKHDDGSVASYAHLGNISVAKGQQVDSGAALGTLGTSGNARAGEGRGVLHFVLRDRSGKTVDPAPLFGAPMQVKSKQQYDRLPSGATYVAPDGSRRVKP